MSIPFIKEFDFKYGHADQLSPLIRRIICKNPGPFTYTGTGTYVIGTEKLAVIDPGPVNDDHLAVLRSLTRTADITHIFVTHTHKDHCGGVAHLKAETQAVVYGARAHSKDMKNAVPALDEGTDFSYAPDHIMEEGDCIETDEWSLSALFTPGHISNHLCFALESEKALFTGDHIMGWATTVVAAPDGNMTDYYQSLELLLKRDDEIYYPTHGAPIRVPHAFVEEVIKHRKMRDSQILEQLALGRTQIMEIVKHVYKDTPIELHIAAALNVQAHLEHQIRLGTVSQTGDTLLNARYTLI